MNLTAGEAGQLWPWLGVLGALLLSRRPEAGRPIWVRRSVILLLAVLTAHYLLWRVSASLDLSGPLPAGLGLTMLVAEAWLLLSGLLPLALAWRPFPERQREADAVERRWRRSGWRPEVDILVPTYGEPLPVLERCLIGCQRLSYPHRTIWVLDDSGRESVAQLAERWGARCLQRPLRSHAKAGNLNHGLRHARGELVVVFDADFVPQVHFLERTLGWLLDPAVALVQTPQTYFNTDPRVRHLALEDWLLPEEESFYAWIQPARESWGAVICAGTSFVVRRSALDAVGGFREGSLSEDFVTGIALCGRGQKLLYLDEKLSAGLAAESLGGFIRQRRRWAAGTLQSLRLAEGPLRQAGLAPLQRLALIEGAFHWINPLPRLLLLLMPLAFGLLAVMPVRFSDEAVLLRLLPLWCTLLLVVGWLQRDSRHALLGEFTAWATAVPLAAQVLRSLAGRALPFQVTPKHRSTNRGAFHRPTGLPLLALLCLACLNLALLLRTIPVGPARLGWGVAVSWSALSLVCLLIALRICWEPPRPDPTPWLALEGPVDLAVGEGPWHPCRFEALSERGVELRLAGPAPDREAIATADTTVPLRVRWPGGPGGGEGLAAGLEARQGGRLALTWAPLGDAERAELVQWIFCRPGCWPRRRAGNEWRAMAVLLSRLVLPPRREGPLRRSLVPQDWGSGGH